MNRKVSFTIPGRIVPKARPRVNTRTGIAYTPKSSSEYQSKIGLFALIAMRKVGYKNPISRCPVRLDVRAHIKGHRRIDIDNILKVVMDGLTGIVYQDDSQVTSSTVEKCLNVDEESLQISASSRASFRNDEGRKRARPGKESSKGLL